MTDPNNIPQQAQQLKEEINAPEKDGEAKKTQDVASTDFDQEYEIAQKSENGSGTQSSDPNPVNRKGAKLSEPAPNNGNVNSAGTGGNTEGSGKMGGTNSPGDSDPADYLDMAKDVTKNAGTKA